MSARLGLDIGGTFTDAVGVLNGSLVWAKAETTHHDLKDCFMEAAARAAERLGADLERRRAVTPMRSSTRPPWGRTR